MKYIELPVRYDSSRGDTIKDARHRLIAVLPKVSVECAPELVIAVNAHDALVAVLSDIFSEVGTGSDLDWHLRISGRAVDIKAALALVKGGTSE